MAEGVVESQASPVRSRWTLRRGVISVILVSLVLRVWSLGSLPLIVTNDGAEYLQWGERVLRGEPMNIRLLRTPGYPYLLAGTFAVFGVGPVGVLIVQHLLGVAACAGVALFAGRRAGPVLGTLAGMACAFDPWLMAFESYALTETTTVALVVAAILAALAPGRRRWPSALAMGLLLGAACLVRPTAQVFVPFLILARALAGWTTWRRGAGVALIAIVGVALPILPWLRFNARRGVHGLAAGTGATQWSGLERLGLITDDFALDSDVREAYTTLTQGPRGDEEAIWRFLKTIDGIGARDALLRRWARASIAADPRGYARACLHSLAWQLNDFPECGPFHHDELSWYLWRLGQDGSSLQTSGDPGPLRRFEMDGEGGTLRDYYAGWSHRDWPGLPQIPLFVAAVLAMLLAAVRREWAAAIVLAGTLAFVLAHVVLLQPFSRYALPAWVIWYAAAAYVPAALVRRARRNARATSGDRGADACADGLRPDAGAGIAGSSAGASGTPLGRSE